MSEVRLRGEIPFPAGGEGVVLRFNMVDCDQLQAKFGENWFADSVPRLNRFDMTYMRECIAFGGKKDGKPFRIDFDNLNIASVEITNACVDALFMAMHGRTLEDHLDYLENIKKFEVGNDSPNR